MSSHVPLYGAHHCEEGAEVAGECGGDVHPMRQSEWRNDTCHFRE